MSTSHSLFIFVYLNDMKIMLDSRYSYRGPKPMSDRLTYPSTSVRYTYSYWLSIRLRGCSLKGGRRIKPFYGPSYNRLICTQLESGMIPDHILRRYFAKSHIKIFRAWGPPQVS